MNIFVFGSNLAGRHGRGSALEARRFHGALQGIGEGPMGSAYAIPTKDEQLTRLPLFRIREAVQRFRLYASDQRHDWFRVVAIGCGLAGYTPEDIAPMFAGCPENVELPYEFVTVLSRMAASIVVHDSTKEIYKNPNCTIRHPGSSCNIECGF